jgi:hypothetical protein
LDSAPIALLPENFAAVDFELQMVNLLSALKSTDPMVNKLIGDEIVLGNTDYAINSELIQSKACTLSKPSADIKKYVAADQYKKYADAAQSEIHDFGVLQPFTSLFEYFWMFNSSKVNKDGFDYMKGGRKN